MSPDDASEDGILAAMDERASVQIGNGPVLTVERGQMGLIENTGRSGLWSLVVGVADDGLTAQTNIWLGPAGAEEPLPDFFADLAENWRGWSGTKEWRGMEGGLRLSCTHDKVGHVTLGISLSSNSGSGWETRVDVPVDPGQLDHIASEVRHLLTV